MKSKHHHISGIVLTVQFFVASLVLSIAAPFAFASEWQKLTQTRNHKVSVDMDALKDNPTGTYEVLLQFSPRGELQRRVAAVKFGYQNYLYHLEQHEIDCEHKRAHLLSMDIFGWKDVHLTHYDGRESWNVIAPDTVLDRVMSLVCPDDEPSSDDSELLDTPGEPDGVPVADKNSDSLFPAELRQRIDSAQRRANDEPGNFDAWVELGNAWYDANVPKQSIEAYDRALELKPNDSDVLNDQGAMYRQIGDSNQALSNFEKALQANPQNLESLYNLGYVYAFDLNRPDKAKQIWQQYLLMDTNSDAAGRVRTFLKQLGTAPKKQQ